MITMVRWKSALEEMKMSKMSKVLCGILVFMMLLAVSGCEQDFQQVDVAGRVYTYTGETFGGMDFDSFTISINEDGTYSYYESMLSSYIGFGKWSVEGDVLTLTEDDKIGYPFVYYFKIDGEDILYIEEGSSSFIYTDVKDGERFTGEAMQNIDS